MQWRRQALYTDGRRAEVGLVEFKACCASSENNASGRQPTLSHPTLPQHTLFICLAALLHNDQNFSYPTYLETKSKHSHNNQTAYPVSPYSDTPTYLLSQVCLTKLDPQY